MNRTKQLFLALLKDDCGQDLIEYAMIAAVLALAAVAGERNIATKISNEFNSIGNSL